MNLKDKTVIVTGGNGFLGVAVCQKLKGRAARIVSISRNKNSFHDVEQISCDLMCADAVADALQKIKPDVVIHLAASCGGIGANMRSPGRYFYENMMMGLNVIHQSSLANVSKLVVIGTVCAYPKHTPVPFQEKDLWNGYPEQTNAPYGIAKKSLLVMLQAYRQQYGLNGIYLLPVNLYGPNDNFDLDSSHVIPALIRKCLEAKRDGRPQIRCWGTGNPSREFLYVEDCAEGIIEATDKYDGAEPVNLGSDYEIKISSLALLISGLTGYDGKIEWDDSKPDGQPRRCLNVTRAYNEFGWRSRTSLSEGISMTIKWAQENEYGS